MWNVKAKVIPVITGTTGSVSKSLRQHLSNITGKHEIKELQKTAIMGTAYILRKVLMYKYKTYFTSEITLHVAQIVNTLHKGDNRDNNNNNHNLHYPRPALYILMQKAAILNTCSIVRTFLAEM
jgi:hypothetical protein